MRSEGDFGTVLNAYEAGDPLETPERFPNQAVRQLQETFHRFPETMPLAAKLEHLRTASQGDPVGYAMLGELIQDRGKLAVWVREKIEEDEGGNHPAGRVRYRVKDAVKEVQGKERYSMVTELNRLFA